MTLTREQALAILKEYNQTEALLRHAYQVAAVMRYFAQEAGLSEAEIEQWEVVGLLHDLDYEQYPDEHCAKSREILEEKGVEEKLIRAVVSHGWGLCSEVEPESEMEKTLYAIDELTGLVYATALMRPSKSVQDLEVKSVKKKFKQASFASGVNREVIKKGAEMLGVELDELIKKTIAGMRALDE